MRDCERAIVIVRAQARFTHTHLRQDPDGRWRWWLLGGGGRVLARSAVAYTTRFICAMESGLLRPAFADAVSLRSVANDANRP
jgi:phage terminase large subunit-like protein